MWPRGMRPGGMFSLSGWTGSTIIPAVNAVRRRRLNVRVGARLSQGENRLKNVSFRVGLGHDTHRLEPGGPLRLGGLDIPHGRQAVGHSDADALLHAIVDALLGAASMGDIGELFPDTDPAHKGRDSATMVQAVRERLRGENYRIVNVDCIVFLQKPKLGPHKDAMRLRIAELLEIPAHDVAVKAKTGEGVDAIGREEAVAAQCVVLVERNVEQETV